MKSVPPICRTLSIEWAADGVRVNSVSPGVVYSKTAAANYSDDIFSEVAQVWKRELHHRPIIK